MSLPHFTDTKDVKETHTVGYLRTPRGPHWGLGTGSYLGRGLQAQRGKLFQNLSTDIFVFLNTNVSVSEDQASWTHPSCMGFASYSGPVVCFRRSRGGNETGPPVAYTLLDLIPCYFFLVEKVNIILFFHTERHFTIHNCDSFLTCYFRKIRKLFFTFCKDLFSYCQ